LASKGNNHEISYFNLLKNLKEEKIPNNILLFTNEKILLDEITSTIANRFLGGKITSDNLRTFYSDDKNIEGVLNECSNLSFFSEKKIIILKVLKRAGTKGGFTNTERQSLIDYINNFDENIVFIINVIDREFNFEHYKDFLDEKPESLSELKLTLENRTKETIAIKNNYENILKVPVPFEGAHYLMLQYFENEILILNDFYSYYDSYNFSESNLSKIEEAILENKNLESEIIKEIQTTFFEFDINI